MALTQRGKSFSLRYLHLYNKFEKIIFYTYVSGKDFNIYCGLNSAFTGSGQISTRKIDQDCRLVPAMITFKGLNVSSADSAERSISDAGRNNLGTLRLLLAGLVILTHSAELMDGNASRDFLLQSTGTTTFSGVAVDGFFLLSGYLIVKSWIGDPRLSAFFAKRVLRILPGYIVATLLSTVAVLALASAGPVDVSAQVARTLKDLAKMGVPNSVGSLRFAHHAAINGSLWTIRWEVGCYGLAAVMGVAGLTRRRWPWVVLFLLSVMDVFQNDVRGHLYILVPQVQAPRFVAFFAAGALFYLYRDRIRFDRSLMAVSAAGLAVSVLHKSTVEVGLATFGAYLLFATAFARLPGDLKLKPRNDVSYGLYLYAWPIQQLLLLFVPGIGFVAYIVASLLLSVGMGFLSWHFVESPSMNILRQKTKTDVGPGSIARHHSIIRITVSVVPEQVSPPRPVGEPPQESLAGR